MEDEGAVLMVRLQNSYIIISDLFYIMYNDGSLSIWELTHDLQKIQL